GFCAACGSHLFWRSLDDDKMAILAASIDDTSDMRLESHIFVDDKGDYYAIDDGLPQCIGYDIPHQPS
ncbi:MAG: GFA family protein, partial [Alphaproteobacteria bacterium]